MRIPFAQIQTESPGTLAAPPQIDTRDLVREAFATGGAMGKTLGEATQQIGKVADVLYDARTKVQVSNEITSAAGELQDARLELEKDSDLANRTAKFASKAEEIRARRLDGLLPGTSADFNIRFNQIYKPIELDVKQDARNQEIQGHKLDLANSLEKMANQAVFAKSPLERVAVQEEAAKQIQQAVSAGYLKASDATQLKNAYLGKVDAALAAEQVRLNPGGAITALGDPNQYPNLSADQRVHLRTQAQVRSESLGAQARAEARADAAELNQTIHNSVASGEPMPPETDLKVVIARLGPKSSTAVRLQHAWDFAVTVQTATAGKTIAEIQAEATRLRVGTPTPAAPTIADTIVLPTGNLEAARQAMPDLSPQEESLYKRHLGNVVGPGGITQKAGARSTLRITTAEIDGDTYVIPTIWDGKELSPNQAIARAKQAGLQNFPAYASQDIAEARYKKLHGFMERDIPQAPSVDDLRLAHTLTAIVNRKVAEKARDPTMQADLERYLGAVNRITENKPPPSEDEGRRLIERAGGIATPIGQHVMRAMLLAKGIEDGLSKTPEELRKQVTELSVAGAPAAQLEYANNLERLAQHKEALRAKDPALHADIEQFGKVMQLASTGAVPLPSESARDAIVERAGGKDSAQGYILNRNYDLARSLSTDLSTKTLPELARAINDLTGGNATPEDLAKSHALSVAAAAKRQARDADEAGYIVKTYPTIGEQLAQAEKLAASGDVIEQQRGMDLRRGAWAAMLEAQKREGVADNNLALLNKAQLEQVKSGLQAADTNERVGNVVKLREAYGEYWSLVARQIWQGKPAPPDVQVIAALPQGAALPREAVVEAFKLSDEDNKRMLGGSVVQQIRDDVRERTAELASTMARAPDGPKFIATYQEAIAKVAELYVIRGEKNAGQAVVRAANDLFHDHYVMAPAVNGVAVRIPKVNGIAAADPSDVSRAQQTVMAQLPNMDLLLPGEGRMQGLTETQQKARLVQVIRSSGYWMTTAGEGGMALLAGPGQYVRFADGSPVVMPFDSAQAIAAQRASSRSETIRQWGGSTGIQPPHGEDPNTVTMPGQLLHYFLTAPTPGGMSVP